MHAIINVKRTIFNLEETEQKACKNSKRLQIRKEIFKDSTDCIPMTIFDNHLSKTSEAKGYQATNVRVSLFQVQRILKTKETTEITDDGKLNLISPSKRKKKRKKRKETIVSVNLQSFNKGFIFPRCNQKNIPYNEITYCNSCNVVTTTDCCFSKMQIVFVGEDSKTQELLELRSTFDVI